MLLGGVHIGFPDTPLGTRAYQRGFDRIRGVKVDTMEIRLFEPAGAEIAQDGFPGRHGAQGATLHVFAHVPAESGIKAVSQAQHRDRYRIIGAAGDNHIRALVHGVQQGIGKAIALAYGREGAHVVVNYLDDQAAAEEIVTRIRQYGQGAIAVSGSVARADAIRAMLEAGEAFGGITILANNAGIFPRVNFLDLTEAQWDEVLTVNLKGSFLCTQAVARQMVARRQSGAVVNLASGAAFRSSPRGVHYVSSKAGIVGLTRATALELAPYQIRVNAIAPGLTDTAQPRYGMSEDEMQAAAHQVPLGRMATPEDIADMAVFLASEEARHVTGQTLHVNGGQYLS